MININSFSYLPPFFFLTKNSVVNRRSYYSVAVLRLENRGRRDVYYMWVQLIRHGWNFGSQVSEFIWPFLKNRCCIRFTIASSWLVDLLLLPGELDWFRWIWWSFLEKLLVRWRIYSNDLSHHLMIFSEWCPCGWWPVSVQLVYFKGFCP